MRALWLVVAVGCTSNPHDLVTCDSTWFALAGKQCERACETEPPFYGQPQHASACPDGTEDVTDVHGVVATCTTVVFGDDGAQGCCVLDAAGIVEFDECTGSE